MRKISHKISYDVINNTMIHTLSDDTSLPSLPQTSAETLPATLFESDSDASDVVPSTKVYKDVDVNSLMRRQGGKNAKNGARSGGNGSGSERGNGKGPNGKGPSRILSLENKTPQSRNSDRNSSTFVSRMKDRIGSVFAWMRGGAGRNSSSNSGSASAPKAMASSTENRNNTDFTDIRTAKNDGTDG
jgi:hypothetical protein